MFLCDEILLLKTSGKCNIKNVGSKISLDFVQAPGEASD